jgi:tellurite resistance protein TerC
MYVLAWCGFLLTVAIILAVDLGVFNRDVHVIKTREALRFTAFLAVFAAAFSIPIYFLYQNEIWGFGSLERVVKGQRIVERITGFEAVSMYLAAYLLELSLSTDNVFVMAVIFKVFRIPRLYQHRVLFWGIMGALILRGVMIGVGAAVVKRFDWMMYVFGFFLIWTGWKMLFLKDHTDEHPEDHWYVRWTRRILPVSPKIEGDRFLTKIEDPNKPGVMKTAVTPLFLALIVVEFTDVIFAVDSIPAVFGITQDPFIVFTSNIFAILGLRSLYFAVASLISMLRFLKPCLAVLLAYIGVKMIVVQYYSWHPGAFVSVAPIVLILSVGIIASKLLPSPPQEAAPIGLPTDDTMTGSEGDIQIQPPEPPTDGDPDLGPGPAK